MRIIKYDSHDGNNSIADVQINFSECEVATIDNALYEASKTEAYKDDEIFIKVYMAFHILREIVNHGKVGSDEIKFAYDAYDKLGNYECWKELEKKKAENDRFRKTTKTNQKELETRD